MLLRSNLFSGKIGCWRELVFDFLGILVFWATPLSPPTQLSCLVIDSSEICNSTTNTPQLCSLHPRWEIECREWEEQWATRRFLGILKTTFSLGTYVCKFSPPVFHKRVCTQKKVRLIGENLGDRERRKKLFLTRPDEREGVIHQT